ncbi:hypothetical protein NA57DRAFT_59993 [Rhizodiscina lignyota]|uniref:Uncharacterized protein n=1 Tax=Rhizodiscina lignyota TaxID=1504668 RepID=A0A9P4I9B0_9PEZI|nr:hypothetical protein NA57DRAFT_59993 [Rhizodiscina lignyota]
MVYARATPTSVALDGGATFNLPLSGSMTVYQPDGTSATVDLSSVVIGAAVFHTPKDTKPTILSSAGYTLHVHSGGAAQGEASGGSSSGRFTGSLKTMSDVATWSDGLASRFDYVLGAGNLWTSGMMSDADFVKRIPSIVSTMSTHMEGLANTFTGAFRSVGGSVEMHSLSNLAKSAVQEVVDAYPETTSAVNSLSSVRNIVRELPSGRNAQVAKATLKRFFSKTNAIDIDGEKGDLRFEPLSPTRWYYFAMLNEKQAKRAEERTDLIDIVVWNPKEPDVELADASMRHSYTASERPFKPKTHMLWSSDQCQYAGSTLAGAFWIMSLVNSFGNRPAMQGQTEGAMQGQIEGAIDTASVMIEDVRTAPVWIIKPTPNRNRR